MTLAGVIPTELSTAITNVRVKRNKWIHGIAAADYQDAMNAVNLARDLLRDVLGLEFQVAPTVGVNGS
jgi:hypothetical protein